MYGILFTWEFTLIHSRVCKFTKYLHLLFKIVYNSSVSWLNINLRLERIIERRPRYQLQSPTHCDARSSHPTIKHS